MSRTGLLLVSAIIMIAGICRADEVLLRNGNVIRGMIIDEDDKKIKIKVFSSDAEATDDSRFIITEIDKKEVRSIKRDNSLFRSGGRQGVSPVKEETIATEVETATKPEDSTPKDDTSDKAATEEDLKSDKKDTPEKPSTPKIDASLKKQIDLLIGHLSSTDENVRKKAEGKLTTLAGEAGPFLAEAIQKNSSRLQTISAIQIMGDAKVKEAVLLLIDQLEGTNRDRSRMRIAHSALKKITGQNIFFNDDSNLGKRKAQIEKWRQWFESVKEEYPAQFGYEDDKKEAEDNSGKSKDSNAKK